MSELVRSRLESALARGPVAVTGLDRALGQAFARLLAELAPGAPPLVELSPDAESLPEEVRPSAVIGLSLPEHPALGLDDVLRLGPDEARRLAGVARAAGGVPLVLASSYDVVAGVEGMVAERRPSWPPTRPGRAAGDVDDELRAARGDLARVQDRIGHADVAARAEQDARTALHEEKEPTSGRALLEERAHRHERTASRLLEEAARERAQGWGFVHARAYGLALAEQVALASGVPCTVVRLPALGPSLDGQIAPRSLPLARYVDAARDGEAADLDGEARLELLPVCVAARALLVALIGALEGKAGELYLASASDNNPLQASRLKDLVDLAQRRPSSSSSSARPIGSTPTRRAVAGLARRLRQQTRPLLRDAASAVRDRLGVPGRPPVDVEDVPLLGSETRPRARGLRLLARQLAGTADDLYRPDLIDWRRYLLDVHLPALAAAKARAPLDAVRTRRPYDSLVHLLDEAAVRYRTRPALSLFDGPERLDVSYRELDERSRAVASRLAAHGVQPGDRVLLSAKNHPAWAVACFGILRRGAQVVPVDPGLSEEQVRHIADKARPAAFVVDSLAKAAFGSALPATALDLHLTCTPGPGRDEDLASPAPDDVASILFTSGTTGDPKGVMLTHRNFTSLIASLGQVFDTGGDERALSVLPLHHTFEFSCGLLLPLSAGAQVFYLDELSGERVLYALREGKITGMVGVPAVWQLLERRIKSQVQGRGERAQALFDAALRLNHFVGAKTGRDLGRVLFRQVHDELGGHIKLLISGGAALPSETHQLFQGLGLSLAEGYGLTETAPVLTVAEGGPGQPAGTVGRPIPGVELRIEDPDPTGVGQVLARGPNVMLGYFENRDATAAVLGDDGWFRTGDLGRLDHEGRLVIAGRAKEVVVTAAGENIYLDDVEDRVGHVPGVAELSLVGLEDPRGGERLALVARPDAGTSKQDAEAALKAAFKKLPAVFRPSTIELVDEELPRTATRKVKRKAVVALLEERLARSVAASAGGEERGPSSGPVRQAVARVAGVAVTEVKGSTDLVQDLGFDSLMWVELAAALEPLCGRLDPDALFACETVAAVEALARAPVTLAPTTAPTDDDDGKLHIPEVVAAPARSVLSVAQRDLYRTLFSTDVHGRSNIPYNTSCIVVANHSSHLDTGLVKYALGPYGRRLRPLAAKDYFFEGNPLKVAFFEHLTHLVPLDRESGSGAAFEQARELVEAGEILLIYPEGTRRTDGVLGEFKPLVGRLSLMTGVPVLPVHLGGAFQALPKGSLLPRQRRLRVDIGAPLAAGDLARLTEGLSPVEAARQATALIRAAVVGLREGQPFDAAGLTRERARAVIERAA